MVVLRAGLCPGLTEEMIQVLRANSIRTGKMGGDRGGEGRPRHLPGAPRSVPVWEPPAVVVVCPGLASSSSSLVLFAVVDFVSSDLEDVSQKCSLSYKVTGCPHVPAFQLGSSELGSLLGWAFPGGSPQRSSVAPNFPSPFYRCLSARQALVAVRRVLLAQFSAFPANGADLYEELKSSTAILPTGSPRWGQRRGKAVAALVVGR